jgi:PAS domain S-box-containing protein
MLSFFTQMFDTTGFVPRGECGAWGPSLGWLHILSDLGVWSACLTLVGLLSFAVARRRDVAFRAVCYLSAALVLACGVTHLMEAVTFWWPAYRLAGVIKLFAAVVCWATVVALVPVFRRARGVSGSGALELEVVERRRSEAALARTAGELRALVEDRTRELDQVKASLARESGHRRRAEAQSDELNVELLERVNELETLLEVIPISIGIAEGATCRRIRANPAYARLLGVPTGANISFSVPQREWPAGFRFCRQGRPLLPSELPLEVSAAQGVAVRGMELTVEYPDGGRCELLAYTAPLFDAEGRTRGSVGAFVDITDRQRAEEALRQSERHFRELAEGLPQLVWTAGADGGRDYLSPQWCAYTGAAEADHLGWRWAEVVHPDDREAAVAAFRDAVARSARFDHEYRIRGADGRYRWFKSVGVPFRDEQGAAVKWFGASTDIEDHKRAEEALREVSRRKDEFLATLAHELRNPLAPLRNALYTIKLAGNDPAMVEQARGVMERQLRLLVRLIDDLLDLSRISQGKIQLRPRRVELADVLRSALETSRPNLDEARQQLVQDLPAESVWLLADPDRLAQVVSNLLNNAAKFTPDGGRITLRARTDGTDAVVSVRDTGVGIPREQLPRLFEMYTQFAPGRPHGGLGIGLSLVRSLVELHGGTVTARSDGPGAGSEFTIRLPIRTDVPADELREPGAFRLHPSQRRVLVVDDNRDSADTLARLLGMIGFDVRVAYEGPQALREAREFLPEVVLLDIGMPGMSGHEVARALRSEPGPVADALLIAMTGWGQDRDRQNSREAGFNAHLVKPVELSDLLPLLATVSTRAPA